MITIGSALNLTKQRLFGCRIGRNEFHQNEKYIYMEAGWSNKINS